MRFEDLYTVMNEVPYYVVPDTTNLDGVTYIDYKVECWAEVAFELKKSFVNILTELNKLEVLVMLKLESSRRFSVIIEYHSLNTPRLLICFVDKIYL